MVSNCKVEGQLQSVVESLYEYVQVKIRPETNRVLMSARQVEVLV